MSKRERTLESPDVIGQAGREQLKSFVQRIERLEEQLAALGLAGDRTTEDAS